jgi:hypothetical protein
MKNDRQLTALIWYVAVVWAVLLILGGTLLSPSFFKPVSTITGIVLLSLAAFDRWLWRIPFLQGWFVDRPDVRGTWRVILSSSWKSPDTGVAQEPIEGYLVVQQTFSRLSLRLFTRESESWLRGSEILSNDDKRFDIVAVYMNEPRREFRHRSPIHQGAFKLAIQGSPPRGLRGEYWTDRNTQGSIASTERRREVFDSFEAARLAFESLVNWS